MRSRRSLKPERARCAAAVSLRAFALSAFTAFFSGCAWFVPAPGIGEAVAWDRLPGWRAEHPAQAWPALLAGCGALAGRDLGWKELCADAALLTDADDDSARAFFETRFLPYVVYADGGGHDGLITGYYEPLLHGSRVRSERFRYPIYARPDDLLVVDLSEVYPELKGKRVRGRLEGRRVVPYPSRAQIESGARVNVKPIVWVDDAVASFFLQVQGSGRVQLTDGQMLFLGYVDQNGHPYQSIGRRLVERGVLKLEDVSMQTIRAWLVEHPAEADDLLNSNPSYVFFTERERELPGPLGALNVPLYPERALAVDTSFVPLGTPVWLDTTLPGDPPTPYRHLLFAQDTGGAIKGPARADIFFGFGARAEELAGHMKQPGRMYVLLPVPRPNLAVR